MLERNHALPLGLLEAREQQFHPFLTLVTRLQPPQVGDQSKQLGGGSKDRLGEAVGERPARQSQCDPGHLPVLSADGQAEDLPAV